MAGWQTMLKNYPVLRRFGEWAFLFLVLLLALWGATQQRETPQLILLLFLYIITFHFALPARSSSLSLMPIVAICSLLISDWQTAVILLGLGLLLSELLRPLWHPLWENINLSQPPRRERLLVAVRQGFAMLGAFAFYQQVDGTFPIHIDELFSLLILSGSHSLLFVILSLPLAFISKQSIGLFWHNQSLETLAMGLFTIPFAVLGSQIFTNNEMPTFIVYCLGIMIANIFFWLIWQRRYTLNQYVTQFSTLNSVGASLRETLDLETVIERTQQQVADLISADHFALWLLDDSKHWRQASQTDNLAPSITPNDFVQWVARQRRVLTLDGRNLHFAERHNLAIPTPQPTAWLGVPLLTAERLIGVMVIQRFVNEQHFSRWTRELFLAIANQASAAIQNARLYGETLRLYNLTDEALARRVRQLQALLNSIQDGVLMLNRAGEIVLLNPTAQTLLDVEEMANGRLPKSDWVNKRLPPEAALQLGYQPLAWLERLDALKVGTITWESETAVAANPIQTVSYHTTIQNQARTLERSEAPVLSGDNQLLGWLIVIRDITTAQELAERRTDLTHMIVHDLRNPITTILSNLNLTKRHLPANGDSLPATELLADARQACHDMLDMVDSLMDINRMEAGQAVVDPEAMNLSRLASHVTDRLRPLAQRQKIVLTLELDDQVPAVWADSEMMRRVLVNLLDNGLKFTPTGGQVACRITADNTPIAGYELGARCEIRDTGPGIPANARELIFDRYMRTNQGGAQVRGTGLGLTFCKLVVEGHNGRIWVEEAAKGGSQFVFTLPGIPVFNEP